MEKTKKGIVIPLDAEWSDVGNWKSLWEISDKDSNGNLKKGNVICKTTENCYLHSENKLLVSLGLKDLLIIETDDATLVAHKNQSENIKELVSELQLKNIKEDNPEYEIRQLKAITHLRERELSKTNGRQMVMKLLTVMQDWAQRWRRSLREGRNSHRPPTPSSL